MSVIIPVRDEARRLPGALHSLTGQRGLDGVRIDPTRFEVIVLANNCSDTSAEVVRRFAVQHPRLTLHVVEVRFPADVAHVGHARSCLMDEAYRRLRRTAGDKGVIASTDGDTRVADDWLAATLSEIDRGADAVGGRIFNGDDVALPPSLLAIARRDAVYQRLRARLEHALDPDLADPWPRHNQHFGASLAITVGAYRLVGGMPPEPFLEDEALYLGLRRHDLNVRHSDDVAVVTSSRRRGRVAVGLSWQLREWQACLEAGHEPAVGDPRAWANVLSWRRRLRAAWQLRSVPATAAEQRLLVSLADRLGSRPERLARKWRRAESFGSFWQALEPSVLAKSRHARRTVSMKAAVHALRELIDRAPPAPAFRKGRAGTDRDVSR
ncbi:MAG: glycosyltransferase family A protein [Caldimonas sp.]